MKSINKKGIKKLDKKLQAKTLGGGCEFELCKTFTVVYEDQLSDFHMAEEYIVKEKW